MVHLKKIDQANVLTIFVSFLAGKLWFSPEVTLGLTIGTALMAGNFYLVRTLVERMLGPSAWKSLVLAAVLCCKFVAFFALALLSLRYLGADSLAMGVGVTAVVASTSIAASWIGLQEQLSTA